ncbi:ATP-dependent helicase [Candidatus Pacearchaeota archaeon]|nr:ATP-dependent helicase [Candidatus Pacearchaeota archaeon]
MTEQEQTYKQARLREKKEIIGVLHPLVKEWFFSRFQDFSLPQLYGVMPIWERKNILISAPTGGTKTLTAFLSILNYLVTLAEKNELEDKVYALYISPLKALSNDIFVNLLSPLAEIEEIANKKNIKLQKIQVSLRTGDTSAEERSKMLKKVPHILITTPETAAIVLNSIKFVKKLGACEYVIVDEIHALANKRGVHLSLSLERLEEISKITPIRIGLSATIAPLEEIARFLTGNRDCLIANVDTGKKADISIVTPSDLIESSAYEMHQSMYKKIDELIQEHKTTLIFTNTRSATERVIHHLKEMFPARYLENIGAHHSSLSKEHRFNIENRLRKGELKVVVSSTSLELGIDIGYVDLVILLGSPKSTARSLQRIGRSGHKLHDTAKGRFLVLDRDDLVECSVMLKEIIERKIDRVFIPKNCLDVLSQQIYGMAIYKKWQINEMFSLIRKSYCYSNLKYEEFLDVISYLAGEYELEHRNVYAKIWYDEKTGEIGKRGKLARVIYMTNIGTIPEESFVNVVVARGERREQKVGVIDEAFLERMKPGDVFVLGGARYQYLYTRGMNVYVSSSVNRPPTIPSWASEMLPLSFDLACEIGRFRGLIEEKLGKNSAEETKEWISSYLHVSDSVAREIYDYCYSQYKYIGIPSIKKIIVEKYYAEKNYVIFHSLFGRRVNDALSRAIAFLAGRLGSRDVEIGISDNGFFLAGEKIDIERAMKHLNSKNIEEILKEAIEKTEVLKRRFRHCATRSLMILRKYKGREKSVGRQQMSSHFLITAVKRITGEFPILKEARREVLEDLMDIENSKIVLRWIEENKIKIEYKTTSLPSPFSLGLIIQGYSDLIKMEDRIEFLKRMHKLVMGKINSD